MAQLAVTEIPANAGSGGDIPMTAGAAGGHTVLNNGDIAIIAENVGAATRIMRIESVAEPNYGRTNNDTNNKYNVSLDAGEIAVVGLLKPAGFNSGGAVTISFLSGGNEADIEVAAVRFIRP